MDTSLTTPDRFTLLRRIPKQLRVGVPKDVLCRLEAWTSGVTYFRGFDVGDAWHYHLLEELVMAFALHQNGEGGRLFSVEPEQEWEGETQRLLPRDLAAHCEVAYSPPADCRIAEADTVRFAEVPDVLPDFIYLDGAPEGAKFHGAEEVYLLEERLAPGAAVMIDGRIRALFFFLGRHAKRKWRVRAQALMVELPPPMKANSHFGLDQYANSLCILER